MYAVVEFLSKDDTRQCAVLPLLWLKNNMTECYWPKVKSEEAFQKLVCDKAPYQSSWTTFSIYRVLHTCDTKSDADLQMINILENGTSEDGSTVVHEITQKTTVLSESSSVSESSSSSSEQENTPPSKKRKRYRQSDQKRGKDKNKEKRKKTTPDTSSVSDNENIVDLTPRRSQDRRNVSGNSAYRTEISTPTTSPATHAEPLRKSSSQLTPTVRTPTHPERNRHVAPPGNLRHDSAPVAGANLPSTPQSPHVVVNGIGRNLNVNPNNSRSQKLAPMSVSAFQEKTIEYFERLEAAQTSTNTMCGEIMRILKANVRLPTKPADMPDFPMKDVATFDILDDLLKTEAHATYLKNRLASIGGKDQRSSVMGMMRFLMTNEVAMRFNWAGQQQKRSFKNTALMPVIYDAAKVLFQGKHRSSDKNIKNAVQDWLKLAKNRHSYTVAKNI